MSSSSLCSRQGKQAPAEVRLGSGCFQQAVCVPCASFRPSVQPVCAHTAPAGQEQAAHARGQAVSTRTQGPAAHSLLDQYSNLSRFLLKVSSVFALCLTAKPVSLTQPPTLWARPLRDIKAEFIQPCAARPACSKQFVLASAKQSRGAGHYAHVGSLARTAVHMLAGGRTGNVFASTKKQLPCSPRLRASVLFMNRKHLITGRPPSTEHRAALLPCVHLPHVHVCVCVPQEPNVPELYFPRKCFFFSITCAKLVQY